MILGVVAFLLVLQAQTVFAADTYREYFREIRAGDFNKAERILKNNANKWSIEDQMMCWAFLSDDSFSNSTAMRTAQLLYQYKVNFGSESVYNFISTKRSEELCRYLLSIGMPIGTHAITSAISKSYTDNFIQFLLEKGGTLAQDTLQVSAQNKR